MAYPFTCSIYCTTRCENLCRHCKVRSPFPGDASFNNVAQVLTQANNLGCRYVDLTGGNPLLVDWLPDALMLCNKFGLTSSLSVSGAMIAERMKQWGTDWLNFPGILRFSIDGNPDFHDANRGPDNYLHTVAGLEVASRVTQKGRIQIVFSAIPGSNGNINRDQLSSVLYLARKSGVLVNVNPLFGASLSSAEIQDLIWFGKQSGIQMSRGKLRFLLRGGNNQYNPTCQAVRSVITVTPDNKLAVPCYYHQELAIPIGNDLRLALNSWERKRYLALDGRHDFCQGCSIWCYIVPSFLYHCHNRAVTWLHGLSGLQEVRDCLLRFAGQFHHCHPYPDFSE